MRASLHEHDVPAFAFPRFRSRGGLTLYDARFALGLGDQQKADLVAFLTSEGPVSGRLS
jgi:hypothetical protein